ncbi:hypothetical protein [Halocatena halophila]|uniref:hypothetical protein n=1 Tax=Halocatena halophila TaxID=2814576 RepID=UPI002ECFC43B
MAEPSTENQQCALCDRTATHQHAITGELTCCGHASNDIDAESIEGHECEPQRTIERYTRDLECTHQDYPGPKKDPIPCQDEAEWVITTAYPGDGPGGAPTSTRFCDEHFLARLREVFRR